MLTRDGKTTFTCSPGHHSSSLALFSSLSFPIARNVLHAFLEKREERGSFKVFDRVADDCDFLKRPQVGELHPRVVTQNGRFHFMKRHQLEARYELVGIKCSSGDKEP